MSAYWSIKRHYKQTTFIKYTLLAQTYGLNGAFGVYIRPKRVEFTSRDYRGVGFLVHNVTKEEIERISLVIRHYVNINSYLITVTAFTREHDCFNNGWLWRVCALYAKKAQITCDSVSFRSMMVEASLLCLPMPHPTQNPEDTYRFPTLEGAMNRGNYCATIAYLRFGVRMRIEGKNSMPHVFNLLAALSLSTDDCEMLTSEDRERYRSAVYFQMTSSEYVYGLCKRVELLGIQSSTKRLIV